jgi:hypothetical protein
MSSITLLTAGPFVVTGRGLSHYCGRSVVIAFVRAIPRCHGTHASQSEYRHPDRQWAGLVHNERHVPGLTIVLILKEV